MLIGYRITVRVTTLSGRELPARTINVRAESREEAESIARGVCQILERTRPADSRSYDVEPAAATRFDELTLETAIVMAVTGKWEEGL
jgi:hypothetical protein